MTVDGRLRLRAATKWPFSSLPKRGWADGWMDEVDKWMVEVARWMVKVARWMVEVARWMDEVDK
jgi:hypothetical protein